MGRTSLPLLLGLLIVPLLLSCGKAERKTGLSGSSDQVITEQSAKFPSKLIKINGVFVPTRRIRIKSQFRGRVEDISVAKGQVVSQGSPLLQIEDDDLPAKLERQRAELQEAEQQLEQTSLLATTEGLEEEFEEEEIEEEELDVLLAEASLFEPPPERETTFPELAANIILTPVDAGGIWPGIDQKVIREANNPEDAGGVWPSYGRREMVNGRPGVSEVFEPPLTEAFLPNPIIVPRIPAIPEALTLVSEEPRSVPTPVREQRVGTASSIAESRLSLDQAKIDRIRTEIAMTEGEIDRRTLTSPREGRVIEVAVSEGSQVEPGDPLIEIIQVDPLVFSFKTPMDQLNFLEMGMEIKGSLSNPPRTPFEGIISFIGMELDADSETVEVRASVDNPNNIFKVGMKGTAEIAVSLR